jgi:hypothetical protein
MEEEHNKVQLVGIGGIALTYVLAVIFNALGGIGGKCRESNNSLRLKLLKIQIARSNFLSFRCLKKNQFLLKIRSPKYIPNSIFTISPI